MYIFRIEVVWSTHFVEQGNSISSEKIFFCIIVYIDWLRAGRSGDRIPVGGEIFRTCLNRPWGPPSLLYNGYRVFPGGKKRPGPDADPSPLLVPWSRKGRAIPLLPLWAVRPVQSLSACTRVHFTYYCVHELILLAGHE